MELMGTPFFPFGSTAEVDLTATWSKLEGKQVGTMQSTGRVRQLGAIVAILEVGEALRPLDNILLRIESAPDVWTSDIYAKAVSVKRGTSDVYEDAWIAELRFTSLNDEDRSAFEALSQTPDAAP